MKILRRLTPNATIYRWDEWGPTSSFLKRVEQSRVNEATHAPEQQLVKYGYRRRYPQYGFINFYSIVAALFGLTFYLYHLELNRNQLKVRDKYRIVERQLSYCRSKYKNLLFKFNYWFERNIFPHEIATSESKLKLYRIGEAVFRYEQYHYYQKNKNNKYEFMDIGTINKYPYPPPRVKK